LSIGLVLSAGFVVAGGAPSAFTEEAVARGLAFTMGPYPQVQGYVGQGAGFVDIDDDGDPDVVVIGDASGRVGIYENIGGGIFVDRTENSGIPIMQQQEGFAAADYDADGFLDLYITQANNRPNFLMKSNGDFTFVDVTASTGVNNGASTTTGPSWGDYNHDGWPDLYVSNYAQSNALYRNNGGVNFSNLAGALGVTGGPVSLSFQTVWTDYDRDGDRDLYLSNDRAPLDFPKNFLWRNDDGLFTDVSVASGADESIFSMGIGAGDIDNNGYPDLYLTNVNAVDSSGTPDPYDGENPLLLNQGDGTFLEDCATWAVCNFNTSWGAIFFDWDNDTFKDLYVNNQFDPNHFFHCTGAPPCTEMSQALAVEGSFDPDFNYDDDLPTIASYTSAVADVDGDGDLDLLVNILGIDGRVELYINQEGQKHNYVRFDIVGEHPNVFALGASVETTVAGQTQYYESHAGGNNYLGQNELIVHVGLGTAESVDQTLVQWPSIGPAGPTRTLTDLPANETWTLYPPSLLCDADSDGIDYDDFVAFSGCYMAGFTPGCEMMDFDGDSNIHSDDVAACYVTVPNDCNANGAEDVVEIMLDLGLDADQNFLIDCCESGTADDPNPIGSTLLLDKDGSGDPVLAWVAPAIDGTHGAATAYDVYRASSALGVFGFLASGGATTYTDSSQTSDPAFYLVGARNDCGTSGEEPL
jgi:hypothetical protein